MSNPIPIQSQKVLYLEPNLQFFRDRHNNNEYQIVVELEPLLLTLNMRNESNFFSTHKNGFLENLTKPVKREKY